MLKLEMVPFVEGKHKFLLNDLLRARGLAPADLSFLPPTGAVVLNHNIPVCIGFLIRSDNQTAECSDFISDPGAERYVRNEAVALMRKYFASECRKTGHRCMMAYCKHPKHIRRLSTLGYHTIETGLTHLGRFLWHSQD